MVFLSIIASAVVGVGIIVLFVGDNFSEVLYLGLLIGVGILFAFIGSCRKVASIEMLDQLPKEKYEVERRERNKRNICIALCVVAVVMGLSGWIRFFVIKSQAQSKAEAARKQWELLHSGSHYYSSGSSGGSKNSGSGKGSYSGGSSGGYSFDVNDYDNAGDFADDWGDHFDNYGDAEDYWEDHY